MDICSGVDQIPQKCKDKTKTAVLFVADDEDFCVNLMALDVTQNTFDVLDPENVQNGFAIKRKDYDFRVELQCKEEMDVPDYVLYDNYIAIQTQDACGKFNEAGRFFDNNKVISCLFLIAIGCALLFLGGYQWDLLMTFVGFCIGFIFVFVIFWTMVDLKKGGAAYFFMFILALAAGAGVAYLFMRFSWLGEVIIGFFLGYSIAGYFTFFLEKYLNDVS